MFNKLTIMAHITRSAKSGPDWTWNELRAYNIRIVTDNVATFFGNPDLPRPSVRQAILTNEHYPINGLPDKDDRLFFDLMKHAMLIVPEQESAVDDFTAHLLKMLGYDEPDRVVRQRVDIPLFICGSRVPTKTDLCVINRGLNDIVLLVQEDKRHLDQLDPEPQLIAEAIATFQRNNMRLSRMGLPTSNHMTIPGITIIGTAPTFFKISITTALVEAVEMGSYPDEATIVHKLVPPVPRLELLEERGMGPLDSRAVILGCFESFKQFI
jgi:hypothetical protein